MIKLETKFETKGKNTIEIYDSSKVRKHVNKTFIFMVGPPTINWSLHSPCSYIGFFNVD